MILLADYTEMGCLKAKSLSILNLVSNQIQPSFMEEKRSGSWAFGRMFLIRSLYSVNLYPQFEL